MCGRFVRHSSLDLIEKTFNVDAGGIVADASYNIAPTQPVLAVVRNPATRLQQLHWGLVPFWAKDKKIGARLINARAESVAEKPSFRHGFKKRRCLIVADGFYEWKGPQGRKQPYYLRPAERRPFGFAGLWDSWTDPEANAYRSCTIITTAAGESIRDIHDRMPVILTPDAYDDWLAPANQDPDFLKKIIADKHVRDLIRSPVSTRVNAVRNNDPQNIEPVDNMVRLDRLVI